jgi:hypothetical protein
MASFIELISTTQLVISAGSAEIQKPWMATPELEKQEQNYA